MTNAPPIWMFQVVFPFTMLSVVVFVVTYSKLEPWWRDRVGQTITIKSTLVGLALLPGTLSLFFHFSRFTSEIAGWFDLGIIFLVGVVMLWRTQVWIAASRRERRRLAEEAQQEESDQIE